MDDRDKTTRELEWFDLETRMRELIHTQLEPVLSKAREDRESTQLSKNHIKNLETRLKSLELSVLGDQSTETIIENIYKRCAEIEGNRKQDIVRIEQSMILLTETINSFNIEIQKFNEKILLLDDRDKAREREISRTNENSEMHKTTVLHEIDKLSENFREMNRVYQEVAMKTEEQANIATAKATANTMEMGNYKREIDGVRKDVVESLSMIKEVRSLKLNIEVFESEKDKIQAKFLGVSEEISKFLDEIAKRDQFIDKYIPLQTVILISDYLYSFIDMGSKKRLADYENIALRELNLNVLEGREVLSRQKRADIILNDMKHVEERKVEFQTKEVRTPKVPQFTEIREKLKRRNSTLPIEEEEEVVQAPPGLSKAEIEKIVQTSLNTQLDAEIGRLKNELKEKLNGFKKVLKGFNSETSSMQTHFVAEMENFHTRLRMLKSDLLLDIDEIRKSSESAKDRVNSLQSSFNSLTQMVLSLYEFSQIDQILQKQDEEDRHTMAMTMEKEMQSELANYNPSKFNDLVALPSANFSLQKKCLSCGTQSSLFSGFRTSMIYHPSSLLYRNKKFERQELLNVKGQVLKKAWESNFSYLGLSQADNSPERSSSISHEKYTVDKSIDKSVDRSSKFSRLGSIDESTQERGDMLPLLISPSSRHRSSIKPKLSRNS